jgi:hypothetical protein
MTIFNLRVRIIFVMLVAVFVTIGCASSELTELQRHYEEDSLPKPGRIVVYNFSASPDDIPADAAISGHYQRRTTPQTAEQKKLGRQLGDKLAEELVKEILALGMPAEHADRWHPPSIGNLLIMGEFISIDKGSRAKRMLIGFGAGAGSLQTHVVGYQFTDQGLRRLGDAVIETSGGKMPGMLVPVAGGAVAGRAARTAIIAGGMNVAQELGPESMNAAAKRTAQEITKILSVAFAEQGWIPAYKVKK